LISLDLNLNNFAVTQNNIHEFKGLSFFQDNWVGVGDTGLYTVFDSQLQETGTGIPAYFITAYNIGYNTRLRYLIIYGEFSGDIKVTVTSDNNVAKEYLVSPKLTDNKQHMYRVPIRRDNGRGSFWTIKVENVSGSDFSIDQIHAVLVPQETFYR